MSTGVGEKEGRSPPQVASESPFLEIWLREQGGLGFWENRRDGSRSDLSDPVYLLSGSFNT